MDPSPRVATQSPKKASREIQLLGVRQNNLKNVDARFPMGKLTVITGLSGSGKSSLAFDTLYAEGQRRYIESLSTYTRQFLDKMPKPELDRVINIPPAIALEQKNHVVNSRATVGTQTEVIDYLRVLYARIGQTYCLHCGKRVTRVDPSRLVDWLWDWLPGKKALIVAPLFSEQDASSVTGADQVRKKATKKATKAKTKKGTQKASKTVTAKVAGQSQWAERLPQLRGQGFQRIFYRSLREGAPSPEVFDLEELSGKENFYLDEIYLVLDRIRLGGERPEADSPEGKDLRSRLLDSVDQGLGVGQGRISFFDLDSGEWKAFQNRFACEHCGLEHRVPEPQMFSFSSPVGACESCSGFGYTLDVDETLVVPDPHLTLKAGAIDPFSKPSMKEWERDLLRFAERHGISILKRYKDLTQAEKKLLWEGDPADQSFAGILACFEELKRYKYKIHVRVFIRRYQAQSLCRSCHGARIKPEALAVKLGGMNLHEALILSIDDALKWMEGLALSHSERQIGKEALEQVIRRLKFMQKVGVGYLTLARLAKTLSGGEFQRINLATQLGSGLCGTLYVLDEPSIGLHAADTDRLISVLEQLRDQGNTVVVVEHDLEILKRADWLLELGPQAGRKGGELVAQGTPEQLREVENSWTAKFLNGQSQVLRDRPARPAPTKWLRMTGCRENNLKDVTAEFPLHRFVVVTGVSGSGKSTLVHKTLHASLSRLFYRTNEEFGRFDRLYGADQISGVVLLDQSPIGKSSRSNPATYLKAWDEVRRIYANQVLSLRRGYTPQHFSFNVDGGRCPTCKGDGEILLDMHFMAEVRLPCEECDGKRFKRAVLDVEYRQKNIDQLLHTTIDEASDLFRDNLVLSRKLGALREVGLGYLQLGQSATTLSGGESQRLKIAATLEDRNRKNLLYIFDEPTTGLHLEDVRKLMVVIQDLVDGGHSVIMIEHHLDVIAAADWVLDVGPEGGVKGGEITGVGSPLELTEQPRSVTGRVLREKLGLGLSRSG
jgi:excinuclease ABC subunit A